MSALLRTTEAQLSQASSGSFSTKAVKRDASTCFRNAPKADAYRRLYRVYSMLVWPTLPAMVALFVLMIWQPRLE